jgi:hypothetical protein
MSADNISAQSSDKRHHPRPRGEQLDRLKEAVGKSGPPAAQMCRQFEDIKITTAEPVCPIAVKLGRRLRTQIVAVTDRHAGLSTGKSIRLVHSLFINDELEGFSRDRADTSNRRRNSFR